MRLINGTNKANLESRLAELQYRHCYKNDLHSAFFTDLAEFVNVRTGQNDLAVDGPLWDTWDPKEATPVESEGIVLISFQSPDSPVYFAMLGTVITIVLILTINIFNIHVLVYSPSTFHAAKYSYSRTRTQP